MGGKQLYSVVARNSDNAKITSGPMFYALPLWALEPVAFSLLRNRNLVRILLFLFCISIKYQKLNLCMCLSITPRRHKKEWLKRNMNLCLHINGECFMLRPLYPRVPVDERLEDPRTGLGVVQRDESPPLSGGKNSVHPA
jgi:hypothetical protein